MHDFHIISHVKSFCHINVHVESYERSCDVQTLEHFLLNFFLVNIQMSVCDFGKHFHLIKTSCCINTKVS